MKKFDFLVVGAGFAGAVCAREMAEAGYSVLLIDKRNHIGGNAYDEVDQHGVLVHPYGPHIFHTNSEYIFNYLSQFTEWRKYEHRVLSSVDGNLFPFPINRETINKIFGINLSHSEVENFLENERINIPEIRTSEDVVLSSVGRRLCDIFFRGYTRKQWGLELSQLSAGVAARIPTRSNDDDRYFTDTFQYMPKDGYSNLFNNLVGHENIEVLISTELESVKSEIQFIHMIYTGPIDRFFGYRFGKLEYRSIHFTHEHIEEYDKYQSVGTINYPNDFDFTRITEFKHITGQECRGTSIVKEFPRSDGEPYYPVPRKENEKLYQKYKALASSEKNVTFVGRLAEYRYYNMDQVVGAALAVSKKIVNALDRP